MNLTRRGLVALSLATPALAQPARPIALVVAYPAGGDTDALARLYAEKLSQRLGRQVVVENRSGASGAVGSIHVSRATPDGETLLMAPSTFPIVPHVLRRGANYDPVRDFTPVIMTGTGPMILMASRQSGIRTLADVQAQGRAGLIVGYGSPGSGSPMHLLGEMFNQAAGLRLAEVAYRGVAPVVNDLLAGVIAIGYATPGAVTEHIAAGTLVPIATSERTRSPILPNVPTFADAGFDVDVTVWWGIFGPRGMPAAIAETWAGHFNAVLQMPDVIQRMLAFGAVVGGGDGARLTQFVQADYDRFGALVRQLGLQQE